MSRESYVLNHNESRILKPQMARQKPPNASPPNPKTHAASTHWFSQVNTLGRVEHLPKVALAVRGACKIQGFRFFVTVRNSGWFGFSAQAFHRNLAFDLPVFRGRSSPKQRQRHQKLRRTGSESQGSGLALDSPFAHDAGHTL